MAEKKKVEPELELFEVLTRMPNEHRTVHRLWAVDQAAAVAEVEATLDPGSEVLLSAPGGPGEGLGPLASSG
jgi:hypothetical protein